MTSSRKTMTEQAATQSEIVIWYRPRIRLWTDLSGEWHLAGEPDGVAKIVAAFRQVARGGSATADVELRTDTIPPERNPVAENGISTVFATLTFEHVLRRMRENDIPLQVSAVGRNARVRFSQADQASLGFALLELLDGEGDFNLRVIDEAGRPTRLWFWGYSNPHGVNSF
jgi:hypothetical protein